MKNTIIKYLYGEISDHEFRILKVWLENPKNHKKFKKQVRLFYLVNSRIKNKNLDEIYHELIVSTNPKVPVEKKTIKLFSSWLKYAAAIYLILAATYFYTESLSKPAVKDQVVKTNTSIGTDKATLTLSNGSSINLEKGKSFMNAFVKSNGEQLVYNNKSSSNKENITVKYNYLTIPRGGQFFICLDDGTKVWLNSSSKIKYPVKFITGQTRTVELIYGEAYFEVAKSTKHNGDGFTLKTNEQNITVLGTEFNVKAYPDENEILTTLVEGSISVNSTADKKILKPGQQSKLSQTANGFEIYPVQVQDEIAWRNGIFSFANKPLKDIMKVLSRWYDLDINIANKDIENIKFTGVLSKQMFINEVLDEIKRTNNMEYNLKNKDLTIK